MMQKVNIFLIILRSWFGHFWCLLCLFFMADFLLLFCLSHCSPPSLTYIYFPFVCHCFLHLCLHKSLLFWGLPPSASLSPFHLYLFLFVSFFSPSCLSPCEGRLKGVIQPCRQLRISSCRRKLHGVSSLPPSLSSLPPPLLAHLTTQSGWSLSLLSDCAQTIWSLMETLSVNQCYATQAEKGFPSVWTILSH